jgi:hypothetical protein
MTAGNEVTVDPPSDVQPSAPTPRAAVSRWRTGDVGAWSVVAGLVVIWITFQSLNSAFLSSGNLYNFEWSEGYRPKFGLIAVDRDHNFARTPKPSAHALARVASTGRLDALREPGLAIGPQTAVGTA